MAAQQTFDAKVLYLKLKAEKPVSESSQNAYLSDVETNESFAELGSDTDEQNKELGMIWQGQYFLTLGDPPSVAHRGTGDTQPERAH